ncbi:MULTISPECIES: MlaA family lipoprotein [Psychrilyobacter]|uniref:VacJ family lipoprotein n=2 Tax=Psychrilyobacter TaxID=623282 RepID=A0ABX9KF75_9FUSO|nr:MULTISPECIES: VacJ family lipoprotein [Psychrilyobacter]NDI78590.1 VacJ family lipoprotein [Psychrilyobacter piezotolerans]RDE60293.1 VacJ family lipoprotein [Psychrilyobacter sp. S5]REI40401.1 VacJ family lipoprotein [Psychrilyobacter piezotolerans]
MKKIFILITLLFMGCTGVKVKEKVSSDKAEKIFIVKSSKLHLNDGKSHIMDAYDPFEPLNRRIYYFNYQFDKWVGLPVSDSYKFFLPQTARTGVGNFFSNLYEPISAINGVLILDYKAVFTGIGRFFINTTIGVAGLFDVATLINIPKHELTLNDTLAVYGVKDGPYLILPFLGPSDLRNAGSLLTTFVLRVPLDPINIYSGSLWEDIAIKGLDAVDVRSEINFRYYSLGTPFEYEYVRLLYLRSMEIRETNIKKN